MRIKLTKKIWYRIILTVVVFWLADFIMHITGVGETNYYYTLKLVNSFLLAFIWFVAFDTKKTSGKIIYSLVAGTWISFTYLVTSYTGLIQFFGVQALYSPPPFVIFGVFLSPFFWWVYHCLIFLAGLVISNRFVNAGKK